jgi:hypothetical protein
MARKRIVICETRELVPIVINGVDTALIGTRQSVFELQIVGRIGENQVDAVCGKRTHHLNAIAAQNLVARRCSSGSERLAGAPRRRPITRDLKMGLRAGDSGMSDTHELDTDRRNSTTLKMRSMR